MPHETEFGLLAQDGEERPRAAVLSDLAARLARVGLDAYAAAGPVARAACLVPHEDAAPYDRAAYGLDAAPAGPYMPAETAWSPERDVKPLVRAWLNSFILAACAGLAVDSRANGSTMSGPMPTCCCCCAADHDDRLPAGRPHELLGGGR